MFYTDRVGRSRIIYPKCPEQVLITVTKDFGRTKSGIIQTRFDDFPITQGFVYGLPKDLSYIERHYSMLKLESHVVYKRYAAKYVDDDHYHDDSLDMWVYEKIFALHVDDIEVIIERPHSTLQKESELLSK